MTLVVQRSEEQGWLERGLVGVTNSLRLVWGERHGSAHTATSNTLGGVSTPFQNAWANSDLSDSVPTSAATDSYSRRNTAEVSVLGGKGACIPRHWLKDVARVASAKHYSTSRPQLGERRIRTMSENTHSSERTDCLAYVGPTVLSGRHGGQRVNLKKQTGQLQQENKLSYSHNDACSAEQGWLEGIGRRDLQLDESSVVGKGALHCDHWRSTGHAHL